MKTRKYISVTIIVFILIGTISSCKTHRDCKGRKKTEKTAMGGWL